MRFARLPRRIFFRRRWWRRRDFGIGRSNLSGCLRGRRGGFRSLVCWLRSLMRRRGRDRRHGPFGGSLDGGCRHRIGGRGLRRFGCAGSGRSRSRSRRRRTRLRRRAYQGDRIVADDPADRALGKRTAEHGGPSKLRDEGDEAQADHRDRPQQCDRSAAQSDQEAVPGHVRAEHGVMQRLSKLGAHLYGHRPVRPARGVAPPQTPSFASMIR